MTQKKYLFTLLILSLFVFNKSFAEKLLLNDEEQLWLSNHPIINIAYDDNFPPYEWKNSAGSYQGISIDYIAILERKLGIKFNQVKRKKWSEILRDFKKGQIDIISSIAEDEKRQKFMLFTKPHISIQGVIVSAKKYNKLSELKGKKIGVVNDYYWDDLISHYDDQFEIIRVETTQSGIELTAIGAIDAMVSDLASVTYNIHKDGVTNLNFVPIPGINKEKLKLSIGIRKDWPILKSILDKAINSINQKEKDKLFNKWIKVQKVSFWQDKNFQYKTAVISLIIIIGFILIIMWNRSLKSQVLTRSEQLEKAHKQLIHAEKMESIGRLSAGVAHEVKNPLAILQMSVDYLKGEDNDETIVTILDDMEDAIVRADKVIKGLLDYSREKELQVVQGNINDVLKKSIRLIQHELKQRNIELKLFLADDLPDLGMDINRLQQVFINLLMNAAQAIGNTGEIEVISTMGKVEATEMLNKEDGLFSLNQNVIVIKILDTGHGLDKKNEKDIFEPFFTTKPVGEGTGLGLSVSKTIIGLHHGMITMKNRTDKQGVKIELAFSLNKEQENEKNTGS